MQVLAVAPERVPLGVIDANIWARDLEEFRASQQAKALDPSAEEKRKRARPIDEKESFRWLEAYGVGCEVAEQIPETTVVVVSDSEADMYEFFLEAAGRTRVSNCETVPSPLLEIQMKS